MFDSEKADVLFELAHYTAQTAVCSAVQKPCGVCSHCQKAVKHIHPDILSFEKEADKKEFTIDIIRDLRNTAYIIPNEAEKKVFILEYVEKMNVNSQNALLKILEEPPKHLIFILTCTNSSVMLPTILSRCVVYSVETVPEDITVDSPVYQLLEKIIQNDEFALSVFISLYEDKKNDFGVALTDLKDLLVLVLHEKTIATSDVEVIKLAVQKLSAEQIFAMILMIDRLQNYMESYVKPNLLTTLFSAEIHDIINRDK